MNAVVNPKFLADLWAIKCNQADLQLALACVPEIEERFPKGGGLVGTKPKILHMFGVPGCGKSTIVDRLMQMPEIAETMFCLGFDRVMEQLQPYKDDYKELGKESARNRWELPARVVGYTLLASAVEKRVSVLFDHTATDVKHIPMLLGLKRAGYDVLMVKSEVTKELAQSRAEERGRAIGGRYTSPKMVSERFSIVRNLAPHYERFGVITMDGASAATVDLTPVVSGLGSSVSR